MGDGLLMVLEMLKKKLGVEAIERDWNVVFNPYCYYNIPSTLIIPDGCKSIGNSAFYCCGNLKKVEIPRSVKDIGKFAFEKCNIGEIEIPNGCTWIDDYAFWECKKLKRVAIPKSTTHIGEGAFWRCDKAIVTLEKPKITSIASNAFNGCKDVKEKIRS